MTVNTRSMGAIDAPHEIRKVTVWGLVVNLILAGLKFVFGVVATSQALVADAVHSLSDTATDFAVLIGLRYWTAPADQDHPHGHGRIEMLVSAFIGLVLGAVGVGLIYRALLALHSGSPVLPAYCIRQPNGRYRLVIEPEMGIIDTGNRDADVLANTQLFTNAIEKTVRHYPDQWLWLHQRWKTKLCQVPDNLKKTIRKAT